MHRFDQVVIGAGFEPRDDVFLGIARGQQQRIDVAVELHVAHRLAQGDAVHFRHLPIGDQHGVVALGHLVERLGAVGHGVDFVAGVLEKAGHEHARDRIILGQQNRR